MTPKELYKKAAYQRVRLTPEEEAIVMSDPKYSRLYTSGYGRTPPITSKYQEKFNRFFQEAMAQPVEEKPTGEVKEEPDYISPMPSVKKVLDELMGKLSDNFALDEANADINVLRHLSQHIEEIKNYITKYVRGSQLSEQDKDYILQKFLAAETLADIFAVFFFNGR